MMNHTCSARIRCFLLAISLSIGVAAPLLLDTSASEVAAVSDVDAAGRKAGKGQQDF